MLGKCELLATNTAMTEVEDGLKWKISARASSLGGRPSRRAHQCQKTARKVAATMETNDQNTVPGGNCHYAEADGGPQSTVDYEAVMIVLVHWLEGVRSLTNGIRSGDTKSRKSSKNEGEIS